MANLEVLALDEATPQIRAPGSGDGYVMPRPLTLTTGTITTDVKQVDGTVTWNASGVTFTAWKLNVTDAASAAGSLLADLQVDGTSKFNINKAGGFTAKDGSGKAILDASGNAYLEFQYSGQPRMALQMDGLRFVSGSSISWSSSTSSHASGRDLYLLRDDAVGTLAQRNSTNAQTSRLYRTYTDASNYQRLTQTWSTSTAVIHNEGAGTGADGSVAFNDAALATDATKGFVMIPSCAGTPTGTPADIPTGQVPIVFDSTNNKLYVYDGGWLATAALT